jgi:hypothetical protein
METLQSIHYLQQLLPIELFEYYFSTAVKLKKKNRAWKACLLTTTPKDSDFPDKLDRSN